MMEITDRCTSHTPGKPWVCVHAQRILEGNHQKENEASQWEKLRSLHVHPLTHINLLKALLTQGGEHMKHE